MLPRLTMSYTVALCVTPPCRVSLLLVIRIRNKIVLVIGLRMYSNFWSCDSDKVEVAKRLLELTHGAYLEHHGVTPLSVQMMALDAMKAIYQRAEFATALELEQCISQAWAEMTRTANV